MLKSSPLLIITLVGVQLEENRWNYHFGKHRKIPKISPEAYIRRGLCTEGSKIDRSSLIVGSKFTVFPLFYFVFEGKFPSTSPQGGLYLEGRLNGGCFALPVWEGGGGGLYTEGLIFRILQYHYHYHYHYRYSYLYQLLL